MADHTIRIVAGTDLEQHLGQMLSDDADALTALRLFRAYLAIPNSEQRMKVVLLAESLANP